MTPSAHPGDLLVRFDKVSCRYDAATVIRDVDFTLRRRDFVGVVGPSGAGKTTLVRALLGSLKPIGGRVNVEAGVRLAYVPQVGSVDGNFPVSVREVVSMSRPGAGRWGRATAAQRQEVTDVLERLGLAGLAHRHFRALSGGQQQRVFLARALVQQPDLLVLDEPTTGVDVRTRHEVLHELAHVNSDGIAIVLTTHDLNGLAAHLPRVICLRETVIADGPPSQVLRTDVLEQTYGAPMDVLEHGGMPVVIDQRPPGLRIVRQDPA